MLSKLFGPKWRHRDPKIRLAAIRLLAADDPVLLERVLTDEDPAIRREILNRVTDLECLQQVRHADADKDVCQCADQRLRKLLCGLTEDAPSVAARLRVLNALSEIALVEHLARYAREVELRRRALERVDRPGLLAQIALEDEVGELRLVALQRVEQVSTLERIAQQARKRDKRVARMARERAAAITAAQQGPQQRQQIIARLKQLAEQGGMDLAGAQALRQQWGQWGEQANVEERQAYVSVSEAFEQAAEAFRAGRGVRQDLLALNERAESIRDDLMLRNELSPEDESTLRALLVMVQGAWDDVARSAVQAGVLDPVIEERFVSAMTGSQQRADGLRALRSQLTYLHELLDAMAHLQDTDNGVSRADIDELKQRWRDAARLRDGDGPSPFARLEEQFRRAVDHAEALLVSGSQRKQELKAQIVTWFQQLRVALEDGQLKIAVGRFDQIRKGIAELRQYDRHAASGFDADLRKQGARMHEMQNWRQFGSLRVREELITRAEQLSAGDSPADVIAEAVPALREQWKALNRSGSRASDEEWGRFDDACSRAYQVVLEQREVKRQRHDEFLAQRESLCAELEQIAGQWDWEQADWKAMEKVIVHAKRLWREAGPVDHAAYKQVDARFRKALAVFEAPLTAEREANWQSREGLIKEVEALVDEPDLHQAIALAKAAQGRWVVTVQGPRQREQAMWRRFRGAMDAVFGRREEQREQQDVARQQLLQDKQAIVKAAAALATASLDELSASHRALTELEQRFSGLETTPQDPAMFEVFAVTRHALFATQQQAVQAQQALEISQANDKAGLCERMEALAEQASTDAVARDEVNLAWTEMQALADQAFESRIAGRFAMAQAAFEHGGGYPAELLQGNLDCKRDLILRMEVASDVPSPDAYAEQRMALKVHMLSATITNHEQGDESPQDWAALQDQWWLCGPVPVAELAGLNERYQRCVIG